MAPHKTSVLAHIKGPNVNLIPQMPLQYNYNGLFVSQANTASSIAQKNNNTPQTTRMMILLQTNHTCPAIV